MSELSPEFLEPETNNVEHEDRPQPMVWIGAKAPMSGDVVYGAWFDAACPTEDLQLAIHETLADAPLPDASGWIVFHYRGFAGAPIEKSASLETITEVARGIAAHGEPFAQWAAYVGCDNREALRQFEDCYLGRFATLRDYIGYVVRETSVQRGVDELPPALRHYTRYTVRALARSWARRVHVVPASTGGFNLFAPPC